jgi:hypothetical protein
VHAVLLSVEKQSIKVPRVFTHAECLRFLEVASSKGAIFLLALQFGDWVFLLLETTKSKASNHFSKKNRYNQSNTSQTFVLCISLPVFVTDLSAAGRPAKLKHIAQLRKRKQP